MIFLLFLADSEGSFIVDRVASMADHFLEDFPQLSKN
jgi:hypothetical protein